MGIRCNFARINMEMERWKVHFQGCNGFFLGMRANEFFFPKMGTLKIFLFMMKKIFYKSQNVTLRFCHSMKFCSQTNIYKTYKET